VKRGGPGRTRVAVILAIGVSLSLILVFFFTASPWTPEVGDANAERMFAALGAVIAALAVWLGGNDRDDDPPAPDEPTPPRPPAVDTGDDE
jgi:hypothetical protein